MFVKPCHPFLNCLNINILENALKRPRLSLVISLVYQYSLFLQAKSETTLCCCNATQADALLVVGQVPRLGHPSLFQKYGYLLFTSPVRSSLLRGVRGFLFKSVFEDINRQLKVVLTIFFVLSQEENL